MADRAKSEAFRRVPETCPTVDVVLGNVKRCIKDAMWHLDPREHERAYDELKDALYNLQVASETIKGKCTEVLRDALVTALEESQEAQDRVEELEAELEQERSDPRPRRDWTDEEIRSASNG